MSESLSKPPCAYCNQKILRKEAFIACQSCRSHLHFRCAKLFFHFTTVYSSNQHWLCDFCAQNYNPDRLSVNAPPCILCNQHTFQGLLKPTIDLIKRGMTWCHATCQQWHNKY